MESSLDMLSRRYKSIPFFALKAAIEATMKKTFSVDLLTRIMIVFPEAVLLNSTGPLFLAVSIVVGVFHLFIITITASRAESE